MGLAKREITAFIGIIFIALILFYLPPIYFKIITFFVIFLTSIEVSLLISKDFFPYKILIPLISISWAFFYFYNGFFLKYLLPLNFLLPLFFILFKNPSSKDELLKLFSSIAIPIFIGYFGGSLAYLREMDGTKKGLFYIIYILTIVWVSDSLAYYFGKNFGKKKIAPNISPNKTIEGTLALFLASLLITLIFFKFSIFSLFLGFIMGVSSFFGDLFQSYAKRTLNLKDSGNFFPGHGGFWDRTDSLFFTSYIFYLIKSI